MLLRILIVLVLFFIIRHFYNKFFKPIDLQTVNFIVGGVKSRKSFTSVSLAVREYKRRLRSYRLKHLFNKKLEKPLLYSNIPLSVPFVPLDDDLLLRKKRFAYGSVVLIDEASLVADSQLVRNDRINMELLLFCKLFGHETQGGMLFVNTHNIDDLHYAFKRACVNSIFIYKSFSIPFFTILKYRIYDNVDNSMNINKDFEIPYKTCLISNKYYKYYDYCYLSSLTDDLPVADKPIKVKTLKSDYIYSFRDYGVLSEVQKNEKK